VSGVTAKSIMYISSSFLHEVERVKVRVILPFFTGNQAFLTTMGTRKHRVTTHDFMHSIHPSALPSSLDREYSRNKQKFTPKPRSLTETGIHT